MAIAYWCLSAGCLADSISRLRLLILRCSIRDTSYISIIDTLLLSASRGDATYGLCTSALLIAIMRDKGLIDDHIVGAIHSQYEWLIAKGNEATQGVETPSQLGNKPNHDSSTTATPPSGMEPRLNARALYATRSYSQCAVEVAAPNPVDTDLEGGDSQPAPEHGTIGYATWFEDVWSLLVLRSHNSRSRSSNLRGEQKSKRVSFEVGDIDQRDADEDDEALRIQLLGIGGVDADEDDDARRLRELGIGGYVRKDDDFYTADDEDANDESPRAPTYGSPTLPRRSPAGAMVTGTGTPSQVGKPKGGALRVDKLEPVAAREASARTVETREEVEEDDDEEEEEFSSEGDHAVDEEARAFGGKLTRGAPMGSPGSPVHNSIKPSPTAHRGASSSKAFNQASPIAKTTNEARAGSPLSGAATEEEELQGDAGVGAVDTQADYSTMCIPPPQPIPPPKFARGFRNALATVGGALHSPKASTKPKVQLKHVEL